MALYTYRSRPSTLPTQQRFTRSAELRPLVHGVIPGGSHTYAKGDDQYPELAPGYIARGKGCHIWDIDGNEFIEYGMGLRSVTLGHAYASVTEAAYRAMSQGTNFNRPTLLEYECALALKHHVPGMDMVKFAKDGSTVVTAALKLARAYTGRERVAICQQSPFFSYNDWFMGTTAISGGVLSASVERTLSFQYNDLASLQTLFDQYPGEIAMVLLEPVRTVEPQSNFLQQVKALAHRHGAVLAFDEMLTGFRLHNGGGQTLYGVTPDLSCFGKAMANGFALSALAGRREIMNLGGLDHDLERVFLLSTTHGAESVALAAAIETMRIYDDEPVISHLYAMGRQLREGFNAIVSSYGLQSNLKLAGHDSNLYFSTLDDRGQPSQALRTLFMQEMIRGGVLAPSFIVSYSHSAEDIVATLTALEKAAAVYKRALESGSTEGLLVGVPSRPVYRRFNHQ